MKLDNKIQKKDYKEKEFKSLIVNFIKSKNLREGVKTSDIVVGTGLSKDWVVYTTHQLLSDYSAHLDTNENGDLLYFFDFEKKNENFQQQIARITEQILQSLWNVFTWFFKLWIVLMLITYLLFNTFVLAIAVTFITRNGSLAEGFIRLIFTLSKEIYSFFTQKNTSNKGALSQVFSYVFGERYAQKDDLFLEKVILEFIHKNKGQILVSDVVKITGWTLRKSEQALTQILANYQGDIEVKENGIIVYEFEDLKNATVTQKQVKYESWYRRLPEPAFNNNSRNVFRYITGANAFNIIAPFISASIISFIFEVGGFWNLSSLWFFFLITFPVGFSILFFLIPLIRIYPFIRSVKKIDNMNHKISCLKFIFEHIHEKVYPKNNISLLKGEGIYEETKVLKNFEEVALGLEPEIVLDEKGTYYTFERLEEEVKFSSSKNSLDSN